MSNLELTTFPEELLEGILSYCILAPLIPQTRPSWHRPTAIGASPSSTTPPVRGRLAFLLVCKQFYRISTPLFYHTLHLSSPNQLHRLLSFALRPNPSLATYIRRVVFGGIWAEGGELMRLSKGSIRLLDITLDTTQLSPALAGQMRDLEAEEFCDGLKELGSLTHLVVRKPGHVYLTQPKPRYVLSEVAKAMSDWNDLEFADLAFRLTDDSGMLVYTYSSNSALQVLQTQAQSQTSRLPSSSQQQGPVTAITHSLTTRPKLHTFSTLLPSMWNETILRVSTNPALERIILGDGQSASAAGGAHSRWSGTDFYAAPVSASLPTGPIFESANHGQGSILGTGLFLMQARKHARLCELIRAGTSIIRMRAQTLGTHPSPSSLPVLPVLPHTHMRAHAHTQVGSSSPSPSSNFVDSRVSVAAYPYSDTRNVVPMSIVMARSSQSGAGQVGVSFHRDQSAPSIFSERPQVCDHHGLMGEGGSHSAASSSSLSVLPSGEHIVVVSTSTFDSTLS